MPIAALLEPTARPGGLLSVARPLPAGWQRGVEVMVGSLLAPERVAPCASSPGDDPQDRGEIAAFTPVYIRQSVLCSALGRPNVTGYAQQAAVVTAGHTLSQELLDGAATGNPSLADAVGLGSAGTLCEAVGMLEAAADQQLSGRLAVLHVPVDLAACLGDTVFREPSAGGAQLRTFARNLVAVHGTGTTIYATGEIWASLGTIDTNTYVDRAVNTVEGWSDLPALAVFDPAFVVAVTLTGGTTSPEGD